MPTQDIFLARQPIFDRKLKVVGYELLARSGELNHFYHEDPDDASINLINDSLFVHTLEELTGDKKAFFNVTQRLVDDAFLKVLPSDKTVLELLEDIEPLPEVIESCKRLKAAGYQIALDDYTPRPEMEPFVELADYIKVDFQETLGEARRSVFKSASAKGAIMIAEKVETPEEFRIALKIGYGLFQGYFFCKPEMLQRNDALGSKRNDLRLLQELGRSELRRPEIQELLGKGITISEKLLRYLNTSDRIETGVHSVTQAVDQLEEADLRRWGALLAVSELGDGKPSELLLTSFVRAHFCDLVGERVNSEDDPSFFLTGLFSILDALVDLPLKEILTGIASSAKVESAVIGDSSQAGRALALIGSYEKGDFVRATQIAKDLGLETSQLSDMYGKSVRWAHRMFDEKLAA